MMEAVAGVVAAGSEVVAALDPEVVVATAKGLVMVAVVMGVGWVETVVMAEGWVVVEWAEGG